MRKKKSHGILWAPDETIGFLGEVRLVRKANGKCDLVGDSEAERERARKWCDRFAPSLEFMEPAMRELALTA
jgi:hypothetical protein